MRGTSATDVVDRWSVQVRGMVRPLRAFSIRQLVWLLAWPAPFTVQPACLFATSLFAGLTCWVGCSHARVLVTASHDDRSVTKLTYLCAVTDSLAAQSGPTGARRLTG